MRGLYYFAIQRFIITFVYGRQDDTTTATQMHEPHPKQKHAPRDVGSAFFVAQWLPISPARKATAWPPRHRHSTPTHRHICQRMLLARTFVPKLPACKQPQVLVRQNQP